MKHLGYPLYTMPILGTAKLLGSLALVQWKYRLLKEWAYAGFAINLIGAVWSHAVFGDPVLFPVLLFLILGISYWSWKKLLVFAENRNEVKSMRKPIGLQSQL
ncbi:MAG: DoxX family protein [Chitinophagaceae bacterium]|nr:DoxX family protein [Chitinophagaceae bacterium]